MKDGFLDVKAIRHAAGGPDWLSELFIQIQEDVQFENIDSIFQNITIISFNYDRCIEHYLFNVLRSFADISAADSSEIMKKLEIFHPYGRVGRLLWEGNINGHQNVEFGAKLSGQNELLDLSGQIKTFTEKVEEGQDLESMRTAIVEAKKIAFLGFSFLDQNMDLLTPGQMSRAEKISGTTYDVSDRNREISMELITKTMSGFSGGESYRWGIDFANRTVKAGVYMKDYGNYLRR